MVRDRGSYRFGFASMIEEISNVRINPERPQSFGEALGTLGEILVRFKRTTVRADHAQVVVTSLDADSVARANPTLDVADVAEPVPVADPTFHRGFLVGLGQVIIFDPVPLIKCALAGEVARAVSEEEDFENDFE